MEKKKKKKKKKPLACRWLGSAWPSMALDPIVHCPRAVLGWPLDVSCRHGLGRWHAGTTRFAPLIWLAMQNIASSSGMGIFSGKFEIERKTSCWVAECFEEEELWLLKKLEEWSLELLPLSRKPTCPLSRHSHLQWSSAFQPLRPATYCPLSSILASVSSYSRYIWTALGIFSLVVSFWSLLSRRSRLPSLCYVIVWEIVFCNILTRNCMAE